MPYSSLAAIALTIANGIRISLDRNLEDILVLALSLAIILSMILFRSFWANHILTFGFMASLAKDRSSAEHSAPAVAMLGWIALLLISYFSFFQG